MTIRTYIGKGNGTFTTGNAYATIADSAFMEATDLDGDGNKHILERLLRRRRFRTFGGGSREPAPRER